MSLHPDTLAATLSRHVDLSNDRRQTLAVLVLGLINARTVNLTHLAGAFCGPAKLSSNYRRLQRFFQYVRLDADWLARTLVALLRLAPPYRLCLDRTNWKVGAKPINLLVLCIVTRRARIPVLWDILDRSGASAMAQRAALLGRFMALFGKGSIRLLLADREFDGNQWFEFLIENDIPFTIRVTSRLRVRLSDGLEGPLGWLIRNARARRHFMQATGCFSSMPERFARRSVSASSGTPATPSSSSPTAIPARRSRPTSIAGRSNACSPKPRPAASTWKTQGSPILPSLPCCSPSSPLPWHGAWPAQQP